MTKILTLIKGDKIIWSVVLIFAVISVLAVYSSSESLVYRFNRSYTEYYMIRQIIVIAAGLILMYLTHLISYSNYAFFVKFGILIAVPLLAATLLMGSGSRWLVIPYTGISFQTSDFAKLVLIIYIARLLALKQETIKDLRMGFIPVIIPIFLVCGLILPGNLSTAALLFLTCLVLMFVGRVKIKYILSLIGMGIICFSILLMVSKVYPKVLPRMGIWANRITNFTHKGKANEMESFQADQAKMAIANGGIFGKLPGRSDQKDYLPQSSSDLIYAIIIEEYGAFGAALIIFLYLTLLYRCIRITIRSPGTFGAFLTMGLCISLIIQAMMNMGVAVGVLPITGQPLPLISWGGTSILFTSIAIGIILSVSKETELGNPIPAKIEQKIDGEK